MKIKRIIRKNWLAISLICSFLLLISSASVYAYIHNQNHKNKLKIEASNSKIQTNTSTNSENPVSSSNTPSVTPAPSTSKSTGSSGGCTITNTPFKTTYVNDSSLPNGEHRTTQSGWYGSVTTCPGKAPLVDPPIDEVIHVGTYVAPATPPPGTTQPPSNQISYQQAFSSCSALGTSGTSAFDQCMHAYGY